MLAPKVSTAVVNLIMRRVLSNIALRLVLQLERCHEGRKVAVEARENYWAGSQLKANEQSSRFPTPPVLT